MSQLSPLTHRTSIRFCTQSYERIKREGGAAGILSQGHLNRHCRSIGRHLLLSIAFQIRAAGCSQRPSSAAIHCCAHSRKPSVIVCICCTPATIARVGSTLSRRWSDLRDTITLWGGELKDRKMYPHTLHNLFNFYLTYIFQLTSEHITIDSQRYHFEFQKSDLI